MQGYKPQYDDHAHYFTVTGRYSKRTPTDSGNKETAIQTVKLDVLDTLKGHKNAAEIAELCGHTYRPEQLHNNGDVHDEYNPEALNLARATHELKTVNKADLAEQASIDRQLWDSLSDSYTQFVRYTRRWKAGYNPDQHIQPDAFFERKVAATKALMQRNSRKRLQYTRRAKQLGIIK